MRSPIALLDSRVGGNDEWMWEGLFGGCGVFSLYEVPVYLVAESGFVGGVDYAAGHVDVFDQAVHVGAGAGEELEEFAVGDCHGDVEVCHVVEGVAAVVDFALHVEAFGEVA